MQERKKLWLPRAVWFHEWRSLRGFAIGIGILLLARCAWLLMSLGSSSDLSHRLTAMDAMKISVLYDVTLPSTGMTTLSFNVNGSPRLSLFLMLIACLAGVWRVYGGVGRVSVPFLLSGPTPRRALLRVRYLSRGLLVLLVWAIYSTVVTVLVSSTPSPMIPSGALLAWIGLNLCAVLAAYATAFWLAHLISETMVAFVAAILTLASPLFLAFMFGRSGLQAMTTVSSLSPFRYVFSSVKESMGGNSTAGGTSHMWGYVSIQALPAVGVPILLFFLVWAVCAWVLVSRAFDRTELERVHQLFLFPSLLLWAWVLCCLVIALIFASVLAKTAGPFWLTAFLSCLVLLILVSALVWQSVWRWSGRQPM